VGGAERIVSIKGRIRSGDIGVSGGGESYRHYGGGRRNGKSSKFNCGSRGGISMEEGVSAFGGGVFCTGRVVCDAFTSLMKKGGTASSRWRKHFIYSAARRLWGTNIKINLMYSKPYGLPEEREARGGFTEEMGAIFNYILSARKLVFLLKLKKQGRRKGQKFGGKEMTIC